ncbi:hypothetical protein QR680_006074 [Steinernema hermaphroditum]|uniref:Uncharacterized protein n=1 Tax=Steinernema hermaphroditum TaxID=289476 RepID=A0AA39HUA3_9BILA|nr:hypothetical protein QR680_006074 [Steinernema hermaphroditum]
MNAESRAELQPDFIKQSSWSKTYRKIFRETSEGPYSPDSLISAKDGYERSTRDGESVQYLRRVQEFEAEPLEPTNGDHDHRSPTVLPQVLHPGTRCNIPIDVLLLCSNFADFPIQSKVRKSIEKGHSLPARRPPMVTEFPADTTKSQPLKHKYVRKTQSTGGIHRKISHEKPHISTEGLLMPKNVETNRTHSFMENQNDVIPEEPAHQEHFYRTPQDSPSQVSVITSTANVGDVRKAMGNLQVNDEMLNIVNKFVKSHFDSTKVRVKNVTETSMPLQYYWSRIVNLSDGNKNGSLKVQQLMTLSTDDTNALLRGQNGSSFQKSALHRSELSPETHISDEEKDLLDIVIRKIEQKIPLDWPELFLLKSAHCRLVIPKERRVKKKKNTDGDTELYKKLESELVEDYRNYQVILEQITIVDDLYTRLAFDIMQAEAYWYAARVISESVLRSNNFRMALRFYADLLQKASKELQPNDASLATICEKTSLILKESGIVDEAVLASCLQVVAAAEKGTSA